MTDTEAPTPSVNDAISRAGDAVELAKEAVVNISAGTDVALGIDNAEVTKTRLAANYGTIVKARAAAENAALEAQKIIADAQAMLKAKMAELAPMLEHAKRLEDGIAAVNLYLGRDEFIETVREGVAAAAGTPLVIRQTVLYMDEESALFAESGGMDADDIAEFLEWMLATETNLDQIVPEKLGVVCIRPRRDKKEYGDTYRNNAMAEANRQSWWIIRNNEQVYLHTTDFSVGDHLVPLKDEFTQMFRVRDFDGTESSLVPGSTAWMNAEKLADAQTRHYMKIALILQGLVDRTTVFHPLPVAGLSLLSQEHYDLGYVAIISDEELVLGVGRPPFAEWQKQHLAALTVGRRVLGNFPENYRDEYDKRIAPRGASGPQSLVAHTITREDAGNLYITYDRTDQVFRPNARSDEDSYGDAKTRATYRISKSHYDAGYLPVDGIDADDLRYYAQSRQDRHLYRSLTPAIKSALEFIEREDTEETPFRNLIAAELFTRALVDADGADSYARELISWWKTANKWHRALNGDGEHERKAQTGVLREAERRAGGSDDEKRIVGLIRLEAPNAIAVARRTNDYVAVTLQPRKHEHATQNVFVTVQEFTKTGKLRASKEWTSLTFAQTSKWSMLHTTAAYEAVKMNVKTKFLLTDAQIDDGIEFILGLHNDDARTPAVISLREGESDFRVPIVFTLFTRSFYKAEPTFFDREPGRPKFVQGKYEIAVTVDKAGSASFALFDSRHPYSGWSTTSGFGRRSEPQPPHEIKYSGSSDPRLTVYRNETEIAREMELGREWMTANNAVRDLQDRGQSLYLVLCKNWEMRNLENIHERFLDDFKDESLWEGHLKAIRADKLQYPYRVSKKPASDIDDVLRELGHALAQSDIDYAGRSVADLLPLTEVGVEVELPADVLALTFPPAVVGTDVARAS